MKLLKKILLVLACITLPFVLLCGGCTYATRYKITPIDSSLSPDGEHTLIFQAVGEPDFPFGLSHARVVLKEGKRTVTKRKIDVANDGGMLHEDSWRVQWRERDVRVILSGEEQPDRLYTFGFDGQVDAEGLDGQGVGFPEDQ